MVALPGFAGPEGSWVNIRPDVILAEFLRQQHSRPVSLSHTNLSMDVGLLCLSVRLR